jgi:PAS domain S-box-containing protein
MKVLVADDSQPIRERLVERLSRLSGVEVAEATDAAGALRQVELFQPDVAVLDIRMPGGGIKALTEIKQNYPGTTVMVMTNYPYAQYRHKCLDEGADFFFDKSTEFEQVAETIRQLTQTLNVGEVALRTTAAQLVAAKEQLEKAEQRQRDMSVLSLPQKPDGSNGFNQAYTMWEKTFDAMPDLVSIFDTRHCIVRVNKAMADRLGMPAAELTGKKCYEYCHGTTCPVAGCPHEAMLKDGREHTAEQYEKSLGGWFNISVSPIYESGRLIGAIHVAHDITHRKKAEALAHSTLDALSAHIAIVDEQGAILAVNRSWTQFAEMNHLLDGAGAGVNYLKVCDTARGPHENEAKQFAEGLRAVLKGQSELFEMEYLCETDTEQFWFCGRVTPLPGEDSRLAAVAHEDITERKQAEMLVKESEERYRQLFESMQTGFALHEIICDEKGVPCDYRFLEINPAFEVLTGLKEEFLIGRTVKEILPDAEDRWIKVYGNVALTGEPTQIDDFSGALGRHYTVSAYSPRKGQFATIFSDVTEQKNAEAAIRQARDAAESSNRAKTQFLANMSHELRTPLNAIIGLTELLEDSTLDEEQLDYIQTIGASGEALLNLVADLLDLSKIEMGKMEVKKEVFTIREVIGKAVALLSPQAAKNGLELSCVVEAAVPEQFTSDPVRIQQVLVNLLNNALKFTSQGFVRLTVRGLLTPAGSSRVEFAVEDSGEGMDEDTIKRIFKPFQQGDSSSTRAHGGAGLGLAISKNLVEMMGGAIHVESRKDKGSRFSFYITDQTVPQNQISVSEAREQWRGRCVCVWGDDPSDMRTAEYLMERCGIMPRYAESIDSISDRLSKDVPADAVLCNLDMPGLAARLSEFRKIRPDVPWIAFSNWIAPLDEQVENCFSAFIDRPLRQDQLYGALLQLAAGVPGI